MPDHPQPPFRRDDSALLEAEWTYLAEAGQTAGAQKHLSARRRNELLVDALTADAVASLELEGVVVPADAMLRCIRDGEHCANPLQRCTADIARRVLRQGGRPVTLEQLEEIGSRLGDADNASRLRDSRPELLSFIEWHRDPDSDEALASPLIRAGLAHLWFESIHPYRFGSGIVGRALAESALMWRQPGMPFVPVAQLLLRAPGEYYGALDRACRDRDATEWLLWFAGIALRAVRARKAAVAEAGV